MARPCRFQVSQIMLWTNECDRVRRHLALSAGGDGEAVNPADVQQHLRDCTGCRTAGEDLIQGQRVLAEARSVTRRDPGPSLWSQLSGRIQSRSTMGDARTRRSQRAGWIPAVALSAACAAVLLAAALNPAFDDSGYLDPPQPNVSSYDSFSGESVRLSGQEGQLILSPQMRRVRSLLYSDSNSY